MLRAISPATDWPEIYARLRRDRGDGAAFAALERHLLALALADLRSHGRHLAEDVAADTCAAVILGLDRARGPETFKGYVIGLYLNTRRSYLVRFTASAPLDGYDVAEEAASGPEYDGTGAARAVPGGAPPAGPDGGGDALLRG